jgi:hypothetical protein
MVAGLCGSTDRQHDGGLAGDRTTVGYLVSPDDGRLLRASRTTAPRLARTGV